jgi:hypothetical protein
MRLKGVKSEGNTFALGRRRRKKLWLILEEAAEV